jgi:hypothetical protein
MFEEQKGLSVSLGRLFIGLTLDDWMTNSILGISCPGTAIEEARNM